MLTHLGGTGLQRTSLSRGSFSDPASPSPGLSATPSRPASPPCAFPPIAPLESSPFPSPIFSLPISIDKKKKIPCSSPQSVKASFHSPYRPETCVGLKIMYVVCVCVCVWCVCVCSMCSVCVCVICVWCTCVWYVCLYVCV